MRDFLTTFIGSGSGIVHPGASLARSRESDRATLPIRSRLRPVLAAMVLLASRQPSTADEAKKLTPVVFGRYELVKGQDKPVCLAVGEQVKAYKRVPSQLAPHSAGTWGEDIKLGPNYDFRCDFPLEDRDGIRVPQWKAFDPSISLADAERAYDVFNGFFTTMGGKPDTKDYGFEGAALDKQVQIFRNAAYPLLAKLISWGVVRFQTANLEMNGFGNLEIYRFSFPPNRLQNCWTIGVDRHSPIYRLRHIALKIRQIFKFGAETYYVTGLGPVSGRRSTDLRVASFDRLARVDLTTDSDDWVKNQYEFGIQDDEVTTCEFNLRGGEKSSFTEYNANDVDAGASKEDEE